ncbi:MAG: hypothetical protein MI747_08905 [Desulfobacterales bacterium]|nr:hypothetical protein [Desulfobacterales bacterium]
MPSNRNQAIMSIEEFTQWAGTALTEEERQAADYLAFLSDFETFTPYWGRGDLAEYSWAWSLENSLEAYVAAHPQWQDSPIGQLEDQVEQRMTAILNQVSQAEDPLAGLSFEEKNQALETLLVEYGQDPSDTAIEDILKKSDQAIVKFYELGDLSAEAMAVIQIQLERVRQANQGMTSVYDEIKNTGTEGSLFLDPIRGELLISSMLHGPAIQYTVTNDDKRPVVESLAGQEYSHETYRLDPPGTSRVTDFPNQLADNTPLLGNETLQTVVAQLSQWISQIPEEAEENSPVYTELLADLQARGVRSLSSEIQPTWLTVTRGPDGAIAALGLSSFNEGGGGYTLDYGVSNPVFFSKDKPVGSYWAGADRENFLAMAEDALLRNPEGYVHAVPANPMTEVLLRDFFFSANSLPHLFEGDADWGEEDRIPRSLGDYESAARDLADRKIAVLKADPTLTDEARHTLDLIENILETSDSMGLTQALIQVNAMVPPPHRVGPGHRGGHPGVGNRFSGYGGRRLGKSGHPGRTPRCL